MAKRADGLLESTYYRRVNDSTVECLQCHAAVFYPLFAEVRKSPCTCTLCYAKLGTRDDNHPGFNKEPSLFEKKGGMRIIV
ncbi:MAG: hypothetical protein HYT12_04400 [Candidatus Liptonbacteria bacterium]|nr:hypothetical protein [Candidatus Liptonbacteria bacterium]